MLNNLREALRPALEKIGRGFASTGLSPDFWTVTGLGVAALSAVVYGLGMQYALIIGGVLLLASGFLDVVDGQVARVSGRTSARGSYLDSVFDKIAEVAVFLGILIGGYADPLLVMLAITMSLLVSYARAKSDALGVSLGGVGIGERAERLLVVAIVGIAGYMDYAMAIVAVIAGITVVQRIIFTTRKIK
ncbi:MAG: CDP-alcohol phosphatidyltransferase family protein [Nitrosopumilus sp. H13]|nr:MAG: CDP-alcohol phosphatidyltransferase family protein [Nitrosopumilus sp. H13]